MKKKTVCVIGLGYIGLPTAALLANNGFSVSGIDINEEVVSNINQGKINFIENNLNTFIKLAIKSGKLKAFSKIQPSDIYIICVPTPFHKNKKIPKPNIDFVLSATKSIANFIKPGDLIILESTCPVGTTIKLKEKLEDLNVNLKNVHIAYCPERVLPGKIMTELKNNDRVIGGLSNMSTKEVSKFYKLFVDGRIFETDAKTAELCKLAENSFRDVNIAFANELSLICDNLGINVWDLIKITNRHPRVNILQPGPGVGGHCIAIDPWFIISNDQENSKLIRSAREINNEKTSWVINKIKNAENNFLLKKGYKPKIACLGMSFKPDIDDLRESKALEVIKSLLADKSDIVAVEPHIKSYMGLKLLKLSEAIEVSDIICILVKHTKFLKLEKKIKIKKYEILDFCGALS